MPTYDYMCDACGYTFEVQHKMAENPTIACPQCGKTVHQVFSAGFGLNFTGKGFYQTDTRKKDSSARVHSEATDKPTPSTEKAEKAAHSCNGNCGCQAGCSCVS